ncbi:MAG: 3,4-dihydroxy-2-butanone-4-phosphate synthase [Mycobacterium sp.]
MSAFKQGQPIVTASPDGCDLVALASKASTDSTTFLIRYGSGFITVATRADRLAELGLPALTVGNGGRRGPALHVAVDASVGVTTGISDHDRALTIRILSESSVAPEDFMRPGVTHPPDVPSGIHGRSRRAAYYGSLLAGVQGAHTYAGLGGGRHDATAAERIRKTHDVVAYRSPTTCEADRMTRSSDRISNQRHAITCTRHSKVEAAK